MTPDQDTLNENILSEQKAITDTFYRYTKDKGIKDDEITIELLEGLTFDDLEPFVDEFYPIDDEADKKLQEWKNNSIQRIKAFEDVETLVVLPEEEKTQGINPFYVSAQELVRTAKGNFRITEEEIVEKLDALAKQNATKFAEEKVKNMEGTDDEIEGAKVAQEVEYQKRLYGSYVDKGIDLGLGVGEKGPIQDTSFFAGLFSTATRITNLPVIGEGFDRLTPKQQKRLEAQKDLDRKIQKNQEKGMTNLQATVNAVESQVFKYEKGESDIGSVLETEENIRALPEELNSAVQYFENQRNQKANELQVKRDQSREQIAGLFGIPLDQAPNYNPETKIIEAPVGQSLPAGFRDEENKAALEFLRTNPNSPLVQSRQLFEEIQAINTAQAEVLRDPAITTGRLSFDAFQEKTGDLFFNDPLVQERAYKYYKEAVNLVVNDSFKDRERSTKDIRHERVASALAAKEKAQIDIDELKKDLETADPNKKNKIESNIDRLEVAQELAQNVADIELQNQHDAQASVAGDILDVAVPAAAVIAGTYLLAPPVGLLTSGFLYSAYKGTQYATTDRTLARDVASFVNYYMGNKAAQVVENMLSSDAGILEQIHDEAMKEPEVIVLDISEPGSRFAPKQTLVKSKEDMIRDRIGEDVYNRLTGFDEATGTRKHTTTDLIETAVQFASFENDFRNSGVEIAPNLSGLLDTLTDGETLDADNESLKKLRFGELSDDFKRQIRFKDLGGSLGNELSNENEKKFQEKTISALLKSGEITLNEGGFSYYAQTYLNKQNFHSTQANLMAGFAKKFVAEENLAWDGSSFAIVETPSGLGHVFNYLDFGTQVVAESQYAGTAYLALKGGMTGAKFAPPGYKKLLGIAVGAATGAAVSQMPITVGKDIGDDLSSEINQQVSSVAGLPQISRNFKAKTYFEDFLRNDFNSFVNFVEEYNLRQGKTDRIKYVADEKMLEEIFAAYVNEKIPQDRAKFSSAQINAETLFGRNLSAILMGKDTYRMYVNTPAFTNIENMRYRDREGIPYLPFRDIEFYDQTNAFSRAKVRNKRGIPSGFTVDSEMSALSMGVAHRTKTNIAQFNLALEYITPEFIDLAPSVLGGGFRIGKHAVSGKNSPYKSVLEAAVPDSKYSYRRHEKNQIPQNARVFRDQERYEMAVSAVESRAQRSSEFKSLMGASFTSLVSGGLLYGMTGGSTEDNANYEAFMVGMTSGMKDFAVGLAKRQVFLASRTDLLKETRVLDEQIDQNYKQINTLKEAVRTGKITRQDLEIEMNNIEENIDRLKQQKKDLYSKASYLDRIKTDVSVGLQDDLLSDMYYPSEMFGGAAARARVEENEDRIARGENPMNDLYRQTTQDSQTDRMEQDNYRRRTEGPLRAMGISPESVRRQMDYEAVRNSQDKTQAVFDLIHTPKHRIIEGDTPESLFELYKDKYPNLTKEYFKTKKDNNQFTVGKEISLRPSTQSKPLPGYFENTKPEDKAGYDGFQQFKKNLDRQVVVGRMTRHTADMILATAIVQSMHTKRNVRAFEGFEYRSPEITLRETLLTRLEADSDSKFDGKDAAEIFVSFGYDNKKQTEARLNGVTTQLQNAETPLSADEIVDLVDGQNRRVKQKIDSGTLDEDLGQIVIDDNVYYFEFENGVLSLAALDDVEANLEDLAAAIQLFGQTQNKNTKIVGIKLEGAFNTPLNTQFTETLFESKKNGSKQLRSTLRDGLFVKDKIKVNNSNIQYVDADGNPPPFLRENVDYQIEEVQAAIEKLQKGVEKNEKKAGAASAVQRTYESVLNDVKRSRKGDSESMKKRIEFILEGKHEDTLGADGTASVGRARQKIEDKKFTLSGYNSQINKQLLAFINDMDEDTLKDASKFNSAIDRFKAQQLPEIIESRRKNFESQAEKSKTDAQKRKETISQTTISQLDVEELFSAIDLTEVEPAKTRTASIPYSSDTQVFQGFGSNQLIVKEGQHQAVIRRGLRNRKPVHFIESIDDVGSASSGQSSMDLLNKKSLGLISQDEYAERIGDAQKQEALQSLNSPRQLVEKQAIIRTLLQNTESRQLAIPQVHQGMYVLITGALDRAGIPYTVETFVDSAKRGTGQPHFLIDYSRDAKKVTPVTINADTNGLGFKKSNNTRLNMMWQAQDIQEFNNLVDRPVLETKIMVSDENAFIKLPLEELQKLPESPMKEKLIRRKELALKNNVDNTTLLISERIDEGGVPNRTPITVFSKGDTLTVVANDYRPGLIENLTYLAMQEGYKEIQFDGGQLPNNFVNFNTRFRNKVKNNKVALNPKASEFVAPSKVQIFRKSNLDPKTRENYTTILNKIYCKRCY